MNLPEFDFKIRKENGKHQIFDRIRKTFVALTPEEWVRQNMVSYLIDCLAYPDSRIANEVSINVNGLAKRCDTVIYDNNFCPLVIAEYKAETVELTQKVFDQAAVYNQRLNVPYLLVSNGRNHLFCYVDKANRRFRFEEHIPDYRTLTDRQA
ncbi:MAG: type I restriction enzyme HsdR N-terminal domain-containing protein [Bacteroidota bacterium]